MRARQIFLQVQKLPISKVNPTGWSYLPSWTVVFSQAYLLTDRPRVALLELHVRIPSTFFETCFRKSIQPIEVPGMYLWHRVDPPHILLFLLRKRDPYRC